MNISIIGQDTRGFNRFVCDSKTHEYEGKIKYLELIIAGCVIGSIILFVIVFNVVRCVRKCRSDNDNQLIKTDVLKNQKKETYESADFKYLSEQKNDEKYNEKYDEKYDDLYEKLTINPDQK